MLGVLFVILLLCGISGLIGAGEMLEDAFKGDWMDIDEWEFRL